MAKVEVEDRAFNAPKLRTAVAHERSPSALILGHALILWRFSQQEGCESASREQIEAWLDVDRFSKPKRGFELLVAAGFLEPNGKGEWKIDGNSWRIPRISKRVENAKAAAIARYSKDRSCDSHADRNAPRMPDRETGRQEDISTPLKAPRKPGGIRVFKLEASAIVAKLIGAQPGTLGSAEAVEQLLGARGYRALRRRFPRGGQQMIEYWDNRTRRASAVKVQRQLENDLAALLAEDSTPGGGGDIPPPP